LNFHTLHFFCDLYLYERNRHESDSIVCCLLVEESGRIPHSRQDAKRVELNNYTTYLTPPTDLYPLIRRPCPAYRSHRLKVLGACRSTREGG
jgi:hypothetical protein